jgi:hypothetical protein
LELRLTAILISDMVGRFSTTSDLDAPVKIKLSWGIMLGPLRVGRDLPDVKRMS